MLACLLQAPAALASDHGGGAAGPAPLKFIVNLGDPSNGGKYLQVQMVFETAAPEAEHLLAVYQPKIQHALILLLSSEEVATLLTLKGKKDLMAHIIETVNHLLHETEKTGIKDVFFTSFIIQ
ncbi:MAG: flagellar basal body-associated FliL family protein [Azonexus sp.]